MYRLARKRTAKNE